MQHQNQEYVQRRKSRLHKDDATKCACGSLGKLKDLWESKADHIREKILADHLKSKASIPCCSSSNRPFCLSFSRCLDIIQTHLRGCCL